LGNPFGKRPRKPSGLESLKAIEDAAFGNPQGVSDGLIAESTGEMKSKDIQNFPHGQMSSH
jgi:hypothetical protein